MIVGDGGAWLRRQYLVMAQNSYTPVTYWMGLPLREFRLWIQANNDLHKRSD